MSKFQPGTAVEYHGDWEQLYAYGAVGKVVAPPPYFDPPRAEHVFVQFPGSDKTYELAEAVLTSA